VKNPIDVDAAAVAATVEELERDSRTGPLQAAYAKVEPALADWVTAKTEHEFVFHRKNSIFGNAKHCAGQPYCRACWGCLERTARWAQGRQSDFEALIVWVCKLQADIEIDGSALRISVALAGGKMGLDESANLVERAQFEERKPCED
jgi:hypothetical protein